MKKIISALLTLSIITVFTTGCAAQIRSDNTAVEPVITLRIGSPAMTVDGAEREIDPGRGTAPVVENGRTLLPVRAVVEAMGGAVAWDDETSTVVLAKDGTVMLLVIGSRAAFVNEASYTLDVAPAIAGDRTMLPIRFIAEGFGYAVAWDVDTQTVTLTPNAPE